MGNEGQDRPQSPASEETKHPWEVFSGEEKATMGKQKKRQEAIKKRADRREKIKNWVKTHKILDVCIILGVVAMIAAAVILICFRDSIFGGKNGDNLPESPVISGEIEGITLENAPTLEYAYTMTMKEFEDATLSDIYIVGDPDPDLNKFIDNANNLIRSASDDRKNFYRLHFITILARYRKIDDASFLLQEFESKNYQLSPAEDYTYLSTKIDFYNISGDTAKRDEYTDLFFKKYPEQYVDFDTGEAINGEDIKWED